MAKVLNASFYCLLWTLGSTLLFYLLFGLSLLTIVCFSSGIILSIINFVEDEMKKHERMNGE
ncbi:hypothetical protein [Bacillus sp. S/N-304-OC-R1]|uniref:hypothetical protein n=1 Tax=Bacillus sp. S/N-304-OC-R1 TaxID=2758034 RepID=UPI001C8EFFF4|nr:hypothetical protein [Bacillus sp. S/N-304-OC-R1]MBY0123670.1 hypothetical protein [Bacillus sp. S/N-304-OC-R1]